MSASSVLLFVPWYFRSRIYSRYPFYVPSSLSLMAGALRNNPPELGPEHPNCTVHHYLIPSLSAFVRGAERVAPQC
ncbi:hypothetical protein EXIGLDRAFT_718208 [Exidia glandulosa HHB12029]|uniref:Uncharacterized protein n=1 Tax=Exidia glandulosa HHB12029 TaxID=1314781 RepID=A0A165HVZ0_EXIGL|nr:hypothetical protein EXIGLDRAFT_718208 [Exidia glandulosa HHB12029]